MRRLFRWWAGEISECWYEKDAWNCTQKHWAIAWFAAGIAVLVIALVVTLIVFSLTVTYPVTMLTILGGFGVLAFCFRLILRVQQ